MVVRVKSRIRLAGIILWLVGGIAFMHSLTSYMSKASIGQSNWNYIWGMICFGTGGIYALGMCGLIMAITGRDLKELNNYWIELDRNPVKKCTLSVLIFIFGIPSLFIPMMLYSVLLSYL